MSNLERCAARRGYFRKPFAAVLMTIAACCALSAPAFAQGETGGAPVLDEILVTATRRAMSVQEIPYNITARSGDQLRSANVDSIADLTQLVPGLAFTDLGVRSGGLNNQLILRGLNATAQGSIGAFLPNATPAAVSTYFGNTPIFTNLKIYDLERVEVLRGPQGTLYGSGSLGGTLRFIFNAPRIGEHEASVSADINTVSDSDEIGYAVDGLVNIPVSKNAALRVAAGHERVAGFTDAANLSVGGPFDPELVDSMNPFFSPLATAPAEGTDTAKQWFVRTSGLVEFSDNFDAQLTYYRQEDESEGFSYQTQPQVPGAEKRTHNAFYLSPLDRTVDLYSLELNLGLGFADVESSTSYIVNKASNIGDLTGLLAVTDLFSGGFSFGGYPATNASLSSYYDFQGRDKTFTQEVRLISDHEGPISWVVGGYHQKTKRDSTEIVLAPGFADYAGASPHPFVAPAPLSFGDLISGPPTFVTQAAINAEIYEDIVLSSDFKDIALFGELTYQLTDAWQVTGGARVFWTEDNNTDLRRFPLSGALFAQDGMDVTGLNYAENSSDDQDQIFKFNTSYDLNDDNMVYFTSSEGFRRGGANAVPVSGFIGESTELTQFDADTVTNYEVGAKGVLFDRLTYTAALFRVNWHDPQISGTALPSGVGVVFSAEEARTEGVELEGVLSLAERLTLTTGYTYTEAKFTKDFASPLGATDVVPDTSASAGDRLPGVPEHIATWALDYAVPVNVLFGAELNFHADGFYRSSVTTSPSPTDAQYAKLDGFDMWNAAVDISGDHWRLGVYVRNITDEAGSTAVFQDFAIARAEEAIIFVSRPRTIGLRVTFTY